MRKFKIEIPIVLITTVILAMLGLSGKQVYESLSEIVDSMLAEARPDHKLMLAKDISSDLNALENTVKLYSLSENKIYLKNYSELNNSLASKLNEFENFSVTDSSNIHSLDSLVILANQKMAVWKNMLNLSLLKRDEHEAFSQYSEKLDTIMVVQDTLYLPEEEKVGFFKRVFAKKKEAPPPLIIDRTDEKQSMQQEIAKLENEIAERNKQVSTREAAYLRKSQEISVSLSRIISELETLEQSSLIKKTENADRLARETFERLAWFALTVFLLMILVLFLFFRDLRKSRAYQKVLRNAKLEAENLARTKEIFAATVSHEMRTPVSAIYGLSEQLLQQPQNYKTQRDLEIIHKSTRHLIDLVNDTFDFTRIENQRLQLRGNDFILKNLINEVEWQHRKNANEKGIQFIADKQFNEELTLFSDESRIRQILNNLLTNAIKFTDRGSVKLEISSESDGEFEILNFVIEDTGVGIRKENQDLIYQDFVQLDTDINKKAGGTGLGLYIVKKLVELLNGQITLESEPGVGTTFKVTLPVRKGDPAKIRKKFISHPAPESLKGKKILIVDDEEFNLHLLRNILNKWQIDFDEAENGQQAVELASRFSYALILMDIRMPVMNGMEATQKLKNAGNAAKIIGLSANTNQEEMKNYLEKGFDSYLIKPFEEAALYRAIKESLENNPDQIEIKNVVKPEFNIDLSDLEKMANGDPAFVKEMIEIFLKSSERTLEAMKENLANENLQQLADLAHKLAAPAKHLNATSVYKTLKQLQNLAESESQVSVIQTKFEQLKPELRALNENLQKLLDTKL